MVKMLTDLYSGSDRKLEKGTITGGSITVHNPCLNWAAGTTPDWIGDSISKVAISGGFFTRIACITASYDLGKRVYEPKYPDNYEEAVEEVKTRLLELTQVKGLFTRTRAAYALERRWYEQRDPAGPSEEALIPWWMRQPALVSKLSMLLSLSESIPLIIEERHISQAIILSSEIAASTPDVIHDAGSGDDARLLHTVEDIIRRRPSTSHSKLLRVMYKHGLTAAKVKPLLDTLLESQKIRMTITSKHGKVYVHSGMGDPSLQESSDG